MYEVIIQLLKGQIMKQCHSCGLPIDAFTETIKKSKDELENFLCEFCRDGSQKPHN